MIAQARLIIGPPSHYLAQRLRRTTWQSRTLYLR